MRSLNDYVSRRAHGVDASGIRKVFDLAAKMKDPINFSIGLPDFDVPDVVKEAAIDAIRAGNNRYTQTQGIAPLRERLRKDLSTEIGRDVGEVLITSGVSGGLLLAILATIDPGDEALRVYYEGLDNINKPFEEVKDQIKDVIPGSTGCEDCLAQGRHDWVHLRVCQTCGHVGCCDSYPGKHTTAHFHAVGHPIARSYEPGEDWYYCYLDDLLFELEGAPPAPSHH